MAIFTKEIIGWVLVITMIILFLVLLGAKLGPESAIKEGILNQLLKA